MTTDDSTLIRRGASASTFVEMAEFVETIRQRPIETLIADLPELATLSRSKFSLARQLLRRRARALSGPEYERLRLVAHDVASRTTGEVGERIRDVFTPA